MSRKPKVLNPEESYTFSKYFELPFDIADILADLNCKADRAALTVDRGRRADLLWSRNDGRKLAIRHF